MNRAPSFSFLPNQSTFSILLGLVWLIGSLLLPLEALAGQKDKSLPFLYRYGVEKGRPATLPAKEKRPLRPETWRPWVKATVYTLAFAGGVALWSGFVTLMGGGLLGAVGFTRDWGFLLLSLLLGGAGAAWLTGWVFNRLTGKRKSKEKWDGRILQLILLVMLGALAVYLWGQAYALWWIMGLVSGFWTGSFWFFRSRRRKAEKSD